MTRFLAACLAAVFWAAPAMAHIGHDLATESHTVEGTSSSNEASFSWSHGGAASGVKGVLVFVFNANNTGDDSTAVTYGGGSLAAVAGANAADTATEPGRCKTWFLGTGLSQGTQMVVVTRNNNANVMYAIAITVTAGTDTETTGTVLLQENGTWTEQSVDDGSPGTNSVRYACTYTGATTPTPAGVSSTALQSNDLGLFAAGAVRETTAGQGIRSVGFSSGTADDRAAVHLAIREPPSGGGSPPVAEAQHHRRQPPPRKHLWRP